MCCCLKEREKRQFQTLLWRVKTVLLRKWCMLIIFIMLPILLMVIAIVPSKLALSSPDLKPVFFPSAIANVTITVTSSEFDGAANVFKKDS